MDDRALRDGIPVIAVPRTLLDLAEVLGPRQLERAFEHAERLGLLDVRALRRLCERSRGRRGLRTLGDLLAAGSEPTDTRSALERRFAALCRAGDLPPPAFNVGVGGFEVDALWPRERLIVELDGYLFHRTRRAFESDRARDADLQLAGYRVLRITSRRLDREPAAVAATVRRLLAEGARRPV
jgi:very-short-patch-repair endonuclease